MKVLNISLVLGVLLFGLNGCTGTTPPLLKPILADKDLAENIKNYKEYPAKYYYKAAAIALDDDTSFAYGDSYINEEKQQASNKALKECNKNKRKFNTESLCVLYMLQDDIVNDIPRLYKPE